MRTRRAERLHHALRALTSRWPWMRGCADFNRAIERLLSTGQPRWVVAAACARCPAMALDLSNRLQRKTFYFPRVYGGYYLGGPLAAFLDRRLAGGATFFDIGANLGWFALRAAAIVGPAGRVLAFEPDPATFASLERTARLNGFAQLRAFHVALSDGEREQRLWRDPNCLGSSLVAESGYGESVPVRVTSLDAMAASGELGVDGIDLIKVDVEGEEPRTVAGMLATLDRFGCPPVWCEVRGPHGSSRAPDTLTPVRDRLAMLGYAPFVFDGQAPPRPMRADDVRRSGSQDVLFERER